MAKNFVKDRRLKSNHVDVRIIDVALKISKIWDFEYMQNNEKYNIISRSIVFHAINGTSSDNSKIYSFMKLILCDLVEGRRNETRMIIVTWTVLEILRFYRESTRAMSYEIDGLG